jgi:signal transduction histidine kinase
MKRWLLSGLPLAFALAILAMTAVALSAFISYHDVHKNLDGALQTRIRRVAQEVANIATLAAEESAGELWTGEQAARLQSTLRIIRTTTHLERLFIFDTDLRSLADALPRVKPGRQYTLLDLSVEGVEKVLQGQVHIGTHVFEGIRKSESRELFNASVPLTLNGEIVGGIYAQASPDFGNDLRALRLNWKIAGGASALVTLIFLFGLIVAYQHIIRVRDEMNKQSRLGIIGLLSAGISHDIKNPLGSIMAASELLERHIADNQDAGELVGYIRDGAERILDITQSLLSGAESTQKETVMLKAMCNTLSKQLMPVCLEKSIKIVEDVDEALIGWGSISAMRMAIANILKNAIEAVPRGEGRIQISGRAIDKRVAVVISDNGPGIPPSMQKKIFDTLVTTKEHGSGIGLPVTRQIIEDMQGKLELETEPGHGSTFILWIPKARRDKDA